jgi:hypothetical protein
MSGKVSHLGITPHAVLDAIVERLDDIEGIFVVTFEEGRPVLFTSGTLGQLCHAGVVLQREAMRVSEGDESE